MYRKIHNLPFRLVLLAYLTGCSSFQGIVPTAVSPTPEPPTATAAYPVLTVDSSLGLSNQYQITFLDNGRTFTYTVTSRFLLYLDKTLYPKNEQVCQPEGIASWVSNAMGLYDESLKLDSVGFEAVKPGVCVIQVRDFRVIIQVVL